jgi:hypothetical protein
MKTKNIRGIFIILVLALFSSSFFSGCSSSKKMEKLSPQDVSEMINAKRFIFVAERVNPMRGRSRNLTSPYDVAINEGTVNCYLPYFGRAYQAPIDPSKGGLIFKSLDFSYNATEKSQDEWQININPKDNSEVQQLLFQVFGNGRATLNVTNTNRDPISFYGYIKKNND